jgi:hypothetical protein
MKLVSILNHLPINSTVPFAGIPLTLWGLASLHRIGNELLFYYVSTPSISHISLDLESQLGIENHHQDFEFLAILEHLNQRTREIISLQFFHHRGGA